MRERTSMPVACSSFARIRLSREVSMAIASKRLNWREVLKKQPWFGPLWANYRGRKQERAIREDDRVYRARAADLQIPAELPYDILRDRLDKRLSARGLHRRTIAKPHILYATPLDP